MTDEPYRLPTYPASGWTIQAMTDTSGVPHTFYLLTAPDGTKHGYGLGPEDEFSPIDDGKIYNDTDHPHDADGGAGDPHLMTPEEYAAVAAAIDNAIDNPPDYNVFQGNECTNWTYSIANAMLGIDPNGAGMSPPADNVLEFIRNMINSVIHNPWVDDGPSLPGGLSDNDLMKAWSNLGNFGGLFSGSLDRGDGGGSGGGGSGGGGSGGGGSGGGGSGGDGDFPPPLTPPMPGAPAPPSGPMGQGGAGFGQGKNSSSRTAKTTSCASTFSPSPPAGAFFSAL